MESDSTEVIWYCGCPEQEKNKAAYGETPPIYHSGQTEHIIQRGNNRELIFAGDDHYKAACLADAKTLRGKRASC